MDSALRGRKPSSVNSTPITRQMMYTLTLSCVSADSAVLRLATSATLVKL